MKTAEKQNITDIGHAGSALILAVVLTSLLAIVGVLFVMAARVDKMATSAIAETKGLDFAVETIIAEISQQLVLDVPGIANEEYYDYYDANDTWLASLQPYQSGGSYYWQQITDLYNTFDPNLVAQIVPEYQDPDVIGEGVIADADGDGVGDSRWAVVPNISSSKGEPIFAAIRIIDNGGMLNVNTGFTFDPNDPNSSILDLGRSSQMQINLMALASVPDEYPTTADETDLLVARANPDLGLNPYDLQSYEENVIWQYGQPNGPYTPFDISDELELRYRFLLNHEDIDTRLEQWGGRFRADAFSTPITSSGATLDAWFERIGDANVYDPNYNYRHIATIHNMDRTVHPDGITLNDGKMINVNYANENLLYEALRRGLQSNEPNGVVTDHNSVAAQLTVNIIDLRDEDADVTVLSSGEKTYYGTEAQPFISEIGVIISDTAANEPSKNYFAIELYNPFDVDTPLGDFKLEIRRRNGERVNTINLTGHAIADGSRFVLTNNFAASEAFDVSDLISTGGGKEDPNLVLATYNLIEDSDPPAFTLREKFDVYLLRTVLDQDIYLDRQLTLTSWFDPNDSNDLDQIYGRADTNWNIIYQEMAAEPNNTLGIDNQSPADRKNYNFYNFANATGTFVSIGDIARALIVGPSEEPNDMIGLRLADEPLEEEIRLNLQNPIFASIFNYLTVIDPTNYGHSEYETRIKGRININTAPWFVLAQLPWMQTEIAREIATYRDTIDGAFEGISALMQVPAMGYYAYGTAFVDVDLPQLPDLTPSDGAISDFEERDVIFSRISNIITVRSDIFTAYILVRIGATGPQKRVLAIFDRSQVASLDDKVRIIALHSVPDPR
ncbi:MAG: helix-hairpin-helix domain-containing protein [Sedimentisphaerales bacterium]|nr:helix-hairpin-helix domain-containing protein [Sedimentisphaerales bacterium]